MKKAKEIILFSQAFYDWISTHKYRLKAQSYAKYVFVAETYVFPQFGTLSIDDITTEKVYVLLTQLETTGRLDGKGGLSPGIIRLVCYLIKSTLDFASSQGLTVAVVSIHPPKLAPPRFNVLLDAERVALEQALYRDLDSGKLGVILCLYTGLRLGELCALRWEDIDLRNCIISVKGTAQRIRFYDASEGPYTVLKVVPPKSAAARREVPFPGYLLSMLVQVKGNKKEESFFLTGNKRKPMDPRTFENRFKSYLAIAGIRDINFHSIRHTFATRCIESGVDAKSLSEILGHASVNTTLDRYVHSSLERKRSQVELLHSEFALI